MKTNIIILFIILVSFSKLCAQQNYKDYKINCIQDKSNKEYTVYNKKSEALFKRIYSKDPENGKPLHRTSYTWNGKEWQNHSTHKYVYNKDKRLEYIILRKWNKRKNEWEKESNMSIYIYDANNKLLSIEQTKIQEDTYHLLTQNL